MVSLNLSTLHTIKNSLRDLLVKMGFSGTISTRATEDVVFVHVDDVVPDSKYLLGGGGERVIALQLVLSLIVAKKLGECVRIVLDVDGYRLKREQAIASLARRSAKKVIEDRMAVTLESLRPFERRIVHVIMQQEFPELETHSVGEDPKRHVIIKFKE